MKMPPAIPLLNEMNKMVQSYFLSILKPNNHANLHRVFKSSLPLLMRP